MKLIVQQVSESGQFKISSCPSHWDAKNWDGTYVSLSGFTGPIKPETFAAAHELLDALEDYVSNGHSLALRDRAHKLIRKAKGETP